MEKLIEGKETLGRTVEKLNEPIMIHVEPDHPLLMSNPNENKEVYKRIEESPMSMGSSSEKGTIIRYKDNELAKEVLNKGEINIMDKRVEVTPVSSVGSKLLGFDSRV